MVFTSSLERVARSLGVGMMIVFLSGIFIESLFDVTIVCWLVLVLVSSFSAVTVLTAGLWFVFAVVPVFVSFPADWYFSSPMAGWLPADSFFHVQLPFLFSPGKVPCGSQKMRPCAKKWSLSHSRRSRGYYCLCMFLLKILHLLIANTGDSRSSCRRLLT